MSRSYRKPYCAVTGKRSAADDKRVARRNFRHVQNQSIRNTEIDWDEFLIPARYEVNYNDVWSWGRDGKQRLRREPTFNDQLHWFHCGYFADGEAMEIALKYFEKAKEYYEFLKRK